MSEWDCSVSDMGRIFFDTATSMNGFIADADHSLQWLFDVPQEPSGPSEKDEWADSPMAEAAAIVMGSTTYEWVLAHENIRESPGRWTELFGNKPVHVFSTRTLWVPPESAVRVVTGHVSDELDRMRDAAGDGDIWLVGGGDLVGQFFDAGALDAIYLTVAPVVLAGGAPLLPRRIESDRLRLVGVRQDGQFARLEYQVVGA